MVLQFQFGFYRFRNRSYLETHVWIYCYLLGLQRNRFRRWTWFLRRPRFRRNSTENLRSTRGWKWLVRHFRRYRHLDPETEPP
jgi:hypothetical protein